MLPPEDRESGRSRLRGALPLLILLAVVLGIWAVSQLVLTDDAEPRVLAYSGVKRLAVEEPERIDHLRFQPSDRTIVVSFSDGTSAETAYPSDASAAAFEQTLDEQGIEYSSDSAGANAWWSFLVYLLPFLLFFGFWILLLRMNRGARPREDTGQWWRRAG